MQLVLDMLLSDEKYHRLYDLTGTDYWSFVDFMVDEQPWQVHIYVGF